MGIPQVPLTENSGTVALLFQQLPDRHLIRMDTVISTRPRSARETDTVRIATGQQSSPRGPADGLPRQEMSKPNTLRRHLIDIRGGIPISAIKGEIPVARIIQVDKDDIRVISGYACHREGGGRGK